MKNIALPYAVLHYEDPIVSIVFKEKTHLGFLEMRELTRSSVKLTGGKSYFTLCYLPDQINITPLGKQVLANLREAPLCKGSAIIAKKDITLHSDNFFHKGNRSKFICKAFDDGIEARQWLLDQREFLDRYSQTG